MASDAARFQLRSQIWSTSIYCNPPTLWMTINPDDLHDPIAQIFAGEDIDMDNFIQSAGPDKTRRSQNIARDPFAAAEFFHFMVTLVLEIILGVKATPTRVYSDQGILGPIQAYFGTVECQGRGTLHLHMLAWLKDAPSPDKIKDLLRTDEFKSRVTAYLRANVRSFVSQLPTETHLRLMASDAEVAYSHLPNPNLPFDEFISALSEIEARVVHTKQLHTCTHGKCLKPDRHGQIVCKRRAPWDLSTTDVVRDDGTYLTKRSLGYLNTYCPAVSVMLKCNNDIKLLLHGTGTNNITFYITGYIAKKQGKSYNMSSLLAKGLLYHFSDTSYIHDLRESQRMLLIRSINVLNREQEVPAPLAVAHLMGWGDVYRSHHYSIIYWGSFVSLINREFPELQNASRCV
jgi:hypothetical protein